ncbi:MAG: cytochrome c3 family protein [Verrucomicrobia bacterium]|nr:cytochrome c3 family protein [Verrucomicrobiota bacterium]
MPAIFPKWANRLPVMVMAAVLWVGGGVTAGVWYYFTPKYTRQGYQPIQPVNFSHATHADQVGIDCRYCHDGVETSGYANLPPTAICMNCHNQVLRDDPGLALVRESHDLEKPVPWVRVHRLPDYVYFHHAVHARRGVSCDHCHGAIHQMEEVAHAQPLSMAFCLDCHRRPAPNLRPLDQVTRLDWEPHQHLPADWFAAAVNAWGVNPPSHCAACHR